ncbi:OsmC family protein [Gallaecimonas kandeliae]|uniref:OsmC family protein n=1 Tax=Gallaecimonas kandeliae TaxID=3029055 RepID=UPI00264A26DB|nr:OsmC family protein [Gallaecimonas kandeliae]WKE67221.1 OsmC family protein [Gallaecimonas kandeliae]
MMTSVRELQAPLRDRYKGDPSAALVVDRAATADHDVTDPFHASVSAQGAANTMLVATHRGHGGPHDAATPGDLLCAALCACHELTLRMVANLMGLEIDTLEVRVEGDVDLRGSLGMGTAPVGFQAMRVQTKVSLRNGGPSEVARLMRTAEACCVVGQTLQAGVPVEHISP